MFRWLADSVSVCDVYYAGTTRRWCGRCSSAACRGGAPRPTLDGRAAGLCCWMRPRPPPASRRTWPPRLRTSWCAAILEAGVQGACLPAGGRGCRAWSGIFVVARMYILDSYLGS